MACNCQTTVNDMLKERNAMLLFGYFGPFQAFVSTIKLDEKKRGKPPIMIASYCPFCGTKYERPNEADASPNTMKVDE